jgi:transcriptional regulator with XRE-family HTH domain
MPSSLKQFRENALARPDVRAAYVKQQEEFTFLDEILRARAAAGLTQAEVAAKIGTTQSAVARLESASTGHSPSVNTLRKYASALGCRVEIKLIAKAAAQRKRVATSTKLVSSKA